MVPTKKSWHSYSLERVAATLKVVLDDGLSEKETDTRREVYGKNEITKQHSQSFLSRVIAISRSPLSLVLVFAGIATLFLGEFLDATVIIVALLINILVSLLQEGKASKIFETLVASQEKKATVIRDGKRTVIPSTAVVPGDILVLNGGVSVVADVRLYESNSLRINEAALTGEWLPIEKTDKTLKAGLSLSEQRNMAWTGTLVTQGTGKGIVVATGPHTRFGILAKNATTTIRTKTPLQKGIHDVASFLMLAISIIIVLIFVLGLIRGEPLVEMLLVAIAVAVAAMPEGLPAAVTVVLAIGMESILKKGGLVKNLLAAETLGSTTIILTDKTGTLTQGKMALKGLYTYEGLYSDSVTAQGDNRELLKMAVLASDAFVEEDTTEAGKLIVHGRPIEKALVESGLEAGLAQKDLFSRGYTRLDFVQFEPTLRYSIALTEHAKTKLDYRAYISGSPEHILRKSHTYFYKGRERILDDKTRSVFEEAQKSMSKKGMRFIAVAYSKTKETTVPCSLRDAEATQKFVFVGLIAFADAVRTDVAASIATTQRAGARVIMATGDYPQTAHAIAMEVGIETNIHAPVLTGEMIANMNDSELLDALQTHSVIARVVPEQKLRVAHILKNSGEVVAMTGDGVNDAPALLAADIGIALGSGTAVAKSAADLILIHNSFAVITTAIAEGRRIMDNLRRIIVYLLSTSFSEILLIGGALFVGTPLPLLPVQILWSNIIEEGFMSFPFAFEPKSKGIMDRSPVKPGIQNILPKEIRWFMFGVGVIAGSFLLILYFILLKIGMPIEEIRTMLFVAVSIDSMFLAFSFKDFTRPLWRIPIFSNKYLIVSLILSFALLILSVTLPPLQKLLSLTALTVADIAMLTALGLLDLFVVELGKMFLSTYIKDKK